MYVKSLDIPESLNNLYPDYLTNTLKIKKIKNYVSTIERVLGFICSNILKTKYTDNAEFNKVLFAELNKTNNIDIFSKYMQSKGRNLSYIVTHVTSVRHFIDMLIDLGYFKINYIKDCYKTKGSYFASHEKFKKPTLKQIKYWHKKYHPR